MVRILIGLERRFVHRPAYREMRHQQAVELLLDEFRSLAPQHDPRPAQVGLEFIECGLDLPALVIQGRQFFGGSLLMTQNPWLLDLHILAFASRLDHAMRALSVPAGCSHRTHSCGTSTKNHVSRFSKNRFSPDCLGGLDSGYFADCHSCSGWTRIGDHGHPTQSTNDNKDSLTMTTGSVLPRRKS